jgi:hypothetical protein
MPQSREENLPGAKKGKKPMHNISASFYSLILFILISICRATVLLQQSRTVVAKPPAFYLVGDSTTAPQSAGGGGWGDGFLSILTNGATGKNYGHNGQTTVSFMNAFWAPVIANVSSESSRHTVYVTIQV